MRIKQQRLELDNKEHMTSRKLLDMERYLAAAVVCTRLQPHLLRMHPASPPSSFIPHIFTAQGPTDETGEQIEGEDSLEVCQVVGTKCKNTPFPYCLKCHDARPDHIKKDCPLWVICRWCYSPLHAYDKCPAPHRNCNSMSCIVPEMHPNYGLFCICDDSYKLHCAEWDANSCDQAHE